MKYLWWVPFFILGCASEVKVESNKSYGGVQRHRIVCKDVVLKCYDKAEDLCPNGYMVLNRVRGVRRQDHTEFELRIRCRSGKVFW